MPFLESAFEVVCYGTGHLVLWAVTLGRWDVANGRDHAALAVGLLFWALVLVVVWLAFFR